MPYTQATRAQFRHLVRNQLGQAANVFWRDTELNFYIQEALRTFNLFTGFWKTTVAISTVAGQVWYNTPGAVTSSLRVSFNGFTLTDSSIYDLDFGRTNWESERTTDGGDVPTRPSIWAVGAINIIALWPADAAGNNGLLLDGIASTPILTTDNSKIDCGQEEFNVLLDLCQHIATFKEGGKEFASTQDAFKSFLKGAGERSAMLRASATYRRFLGLDTQRFKRPAMQGDPQVQGAR